MISRCPQDLRIAFLPLYRLAVLALAASDGFLCEDFRSVEESVRNSYSEDWTRILTACSSSSSLSTAESSSASLLCSAPLPVVFSVSLAAAVPLTLSAPFFNAEALPLPLSEIGAPFVGLEDVPLGLLDDAFGLGAKIDATFFASVGALTVQNKVSTA